LFGKSFFLRGLSEERFFMGNLAMQKTLPLTDNKSFEHILENKFSGLDICIISRPRMKKGWRIERKWGRYLLIIPSVFINAPDDIKIALLKWAQILISNRFSRKNNSASTKKSIKDLENIIYAYLRAEFGETNGRRTFSSPQIRFKNTIGVKYDLRKIFDKINNEYFNGTIDCFLRWGKEKSRTSYHAICNDENGKSFNLITIAGVYNQKKTPEFAIESVMYHEMLHIAFPPIETGTKRNVHHIRFRQMERQFPHYEEWKNWQNSKKKVI